MNRFPYAKVVAILASVFGIALGLCGASLLLGSAGLRIPDQLLLSSGMVELAVMLLSGLGLLVTVILWVIASIFKRDDERRDQ